MTRKCRGAEYRIHVKNSGGKAEEGAGSEGGASPPRPFSSRKAATQASGAFQLMAISLADQASMLSTKHFSGAQPARPAAWT